MTSVAGTRTALDLGLSRLLTLFRQAPIIPLVILLVGLIVISELLRPGFFSVNSAVGWIRLALPLAILGASQTLTMLTGGIDLSVAVVASMTGFLVATLVGTLGIWPSVGIALLCAGLAGLVSGIGVGVFRVHPLIMTLGMSLVVSGLANVWQVQRVQTGAGVPREFRVIGAGTLGDVAQTGTVIDILPNSLFIFVPLAVLVLLLLHRFGYGRLLYAIGDNPIAARLSGVKSWQVLIVLYVISALLAGIAGFIWAGLTNTASVTLVDAQLLPSVAAAVIGGTSILGGRGGYGGTMVGALILTVMAALLQALGFREADRLILFGSIVIIFTAIYARVTTDT